MYREKGTKSQTNEHQIIMIEINLKDEHDEFCRMELIA